MQKSCTLVLDTSASPLLMAVEKDGQVYTSRRKGIKQEKLLFPVLQQLLNRAQASLKEVTRVFIVRGPGRFTGIRIALTFASMMQSLSRAQVSSATLFELLCAQATASRSYARWKAQNPDGVVAVVLHAFREEYFLQVFDYPQATPRWLSRQELLAQLAACTRPLFVVGTDKDFAPLDGLLGNRYCLAAARDCRVQTGTLLDFCRQGKGTYRPLEPLYLKPARFEQVEPK